MSESLLSPSQIKLFGRLFDGLQLTPPGSSVVAPNPLELPTAEEAAAEKTLDEEAADLEEAAKEAETIRKASNQPAQPDAKFDLLTNQLLREGATLARIYGFSYEGEFIKLPSPTVFMVHGSGRPVPVNFSGMTDISGVAIRDWAFEGEIHYWEYDRVNYSLRCDIVSGTLDDILIQACMDADIEPGARASNMVSRASNMVSRASNMVSRASNMVARSDLTAQHRIR